MPDQVEKEYDPLDDIFLDHAPSVDKAMVARLLKPYIQLYADSKEVLPTPEWDKLNIQQKILMWMLGLKALRLRGVITEDDEKISPSDLEKATGLKGGSIRPSLSKLLDTRMLRIDKETNKYVLPDFAVRKIAEVLDKGDQS